MNFLELKRKHIVSDKITDIKQAKDVRFCGISRKQQRTNSQGNCSFLSLGVFAPTVFSKAYGTLQCQHCVNDSNQVNISDNPAWNQSYQLRCSECRYSIVSQFYYNLNAPYKYASSLKSWVHVGRKT